MINNMRFKRRASLNGKICVRGFTVMLLLLSMLLSFSACNTSRGGKQETPVPGESEGQMEVNTPVPPELSGCAIVEKENLNIAQPYIKIYDVYGAAPSYIQLDEVAAKALTQELSAISKIEISGKIENSEALFPENLYLYIGDKLVGEKTDFNGGYAVLMNTAGELCLRDVDADIYYSAEDVCKNIISIAASLNVYSHITKDDIKSIVKAEQMTQSVKTAEITAATELSKIEQLFRKAERIANPGTYTFEQVLILTTSDGKAIEIELDKDNDICVIGHTYWYDYGPGVDGGNARNAKSELLMLLGQAA